MLVTRRRMALIAVLAAALAAVVLVVGLNAADAPPPLRAGVLAGASAERGRDAIHAYGCGTCHTIPGVDGADAIVAPPLDRWAERAYVGGRLANTPANVARWIGAPQAIVAGNAMPDLGVPPHVARDMAAYLFTLR